MLVAACVKHPSYPPPPPSPRPPLRACQLDLWLCRYVAVTKGVVEVRKEEGRPASAEGSQGEEYVQRSFDLTTQEGLAAYWAQLAQMSVDYR